MANGFRNRRVRFGTDSAIWGRQDCWTPPLEVLGGAEGDREDFAIARYVTLKLTGIPSEKRRMTYVKARIGGPQSTHEQAHWVLSQYPAPGDELPGRDNLNSGIGPAFRYSDPAMVFGFTTEGLGVDRVNLRAASTSQRDSKWQSVFAGMREEGIN